MGRWSDREKAQYGVMRDGDSFLTEKVFHADSIFESNY
jgi:hypothetical protein